MNRFAILFAVFAYFATFARVSADITSFNNFENGNDDDVLSNAILNVGVRGNGTWWVTNLTTSSATTPQMRITTGFEGPYFGYVMWGQQTNRAITIGGTNFFDTGSTRGVRVYYTNAQRAYVSQRVPNCQKITVGAYMRLSNGWTNATGGDIFSQDLITITLDNGDFLVMNLQNYQVGSRGTNFVQTHTLQGTAESEGGANFETNVMRMLPGQTYWVTMKVDVTEGTDGNGYIWWYDTNTWARVGNSVLKLGAASSSANRIQYVQFGQYEPHSDAQAAGTYIDFDDFITDTNSSPRWPLIPSSKAQLAWAATRAGADSAFSAASSDDWLFLPKSNQTWTTTFNVTKRVVICGLGTNNPITFDVATQTTDGFLVSQDWTRIMNLALKCPAGANEGRMVLIEGGQYCRVDHCFIGEAFWGVYSKGFNSIDQNTFLNCEKSIRRHGYPNEDTLWTTYTNADWNTTNYNYSERNTFIVNSSAVDVGPRNVDSSQQAAMLCDRTNTYILSGPWSFEPIRDSHGNNTSGLRGVIAAISLGNTITMSGGSVIGTARWDMRGGRYLINGDTLTGASGNDRMREEFETTSPLDRIWKTYIWNNTGIGITIGTGNEDFIIENTHYFLAQPSPSPDMPGFPNHIVQYWDGTTYSYFPGGGFAPACCVTAVSTGRPKKD